MKSIINKDRYRVILKQIFKDTPHFIRQVSEWHTQNQFEDKLAIEYVLKELQFHHELLPGKKASLLTNKEFLRTYSIRQKGLKTLPKDWMDVHIQKIDQMVLDNLWLKPSEGYLVRLLRASPHKKDQKRLQKILKSKAYQYRGVDKSVEERRQIRLEKLQKSIDNQKIVIFLGRQNVIYQALQAQLNQKYQGKLQFISDHVWSSCGYTERGMKTSDNRLSLIQAAETIFRLPKLGLKGEEISNRFISFSLDGYDMKHTLAAMYSNSNRVARNYPRPKIEGLDSFEFSYTGLTDLELANLVRHPQWFALTKFCRTNSNGELEELTQNQVLQEYGIKYIGDLIF